MAYPVRLADRVRQAVGPRADVNGYVFVGPGGTRTAKAIAMWVDQSIAFVATVERAAKKPRARRRAR